MNQQLPARYAWLAVAVALLTAVLKGLACVLTNSVALFSDALESIVNLVTATLLVVLLKVAKAPPDEEHPYGHDKAEYFANGAQGTLILLAAVGIVAAALERFNHPRPPDADSAGLTLATVSALINFLAARFLKRRGQETHSQALSGEADHLMSDVWTSVAVLIGLGLTYATGKAWLDPLSALLVSAVVFKTGWDLLRSFVSGLMDTSLSEEERAKIRAALERYREEHGIDYHALRTRKSGARRFVSLHVLVPGDWSVSRGHQLMDELENDVSGVLSGGVTVLTHLEPLGEACSFDDIELQ